MRGILFIVILSFPLMVGLGSLLDTILIGNHEYNVYLLTCLWEFFLIWGGFFGGYIYAKTQRE